MTLLLLLRTNGGAAAPPGSAYASGSWARGMRVFKFRVRGDVWVEPGHVESTDPTLDTEER